MTAGNRLATADRHRVKHTRRLFGIIHERREKRRLVARLDTANDVQVQFHKVFLIIENPPTNPQIKPCDILDGPISDQIGIQFGANTGNQTAQFRAEVFRRSCVNLVATAGAR